MRSANPLRWYYQEKKVENPVPANLVSKMDGVYTPEPFNDGRPGARDHMAIGSVRGDRKVEQYVAGNLRGKD